MFLARHLGVRINRCSVSYSCPPLTYSPSGHVLNTQAFRQSNSGWLYSVQFRSRSLVQKSASLQSFRAHVYFPIQCDRTDCRVWSRFSPSISTSLSRLKVSNFGQIRNEGPECLCVEIIPLRRSFHSVAVEETVRFVSLRFGLGKSWTPFAEVWCPQFGNEGGDRDVSCMLFNIGKQNRVQLRESERYDIATSRF